MHWDIYVLALVKVRETFNVKQLSYLRALIKLKHILTTKLFDCIYIS